MFGSRVNVDNSSLKKKTNIGGRRILIYMHGCDFREMHYTVTLALRGTTYSRIRAHPGFHLYIIFNRVQSCHESQPKGFASLHFVTMVES